MDLFRSVDVDAFWTAPRAGRGDAVMMVTFENITGVGIPDHYFGGPLVDKFVIDIAHVVPAKPEWYHCDSIERCLEAVRPVLAANALTYGSSMGGYAVARFTDALGLARGIAMSPQVSIQAAVVPYETRWRAEAAATTFRHDDSLPPRAATLWIFVDPEHENDLRHAEAIAAAGPSHIVHVPYGGHPVARALLEAGVLSKVMRMFIEGTEDHAAFDAIIAEGMAKAPTVLLNRARGLSGGDREALLRQALTLDPTHRKAAMALGHLLMRCGDPEEAQRVFAIALRPPFRYAKWEKMYLAACAQAGVAPMLLDGTSEALLQRSAP